MFNRLSKLFAVVFFIPILIAACGTQPAPITATSGPAASVQNTKVPAGSVQSTKAPGATIQSTKAPAVEGGEGGVEAALVTYSDAKQGFSIGHPGTWTQDKTVTSGAKFVGGDDSLALEFVTPPAGTDAMSYAKNDVAAVTATYPGFKQIDLKASSEVQNAIILGFTANGTSAVTGKAFTAHNERYYMPLKDGRLAVLTVIGPDNQYDREGVRDIALTFKLSK